MFPLVLINHHPQHTITIKHKIYHCNIHAVSALGQHINGDEINAWNGLHRTESIMLVMLVRYTGTFCAMPVRHGPLTYN